MKRNSKKRHIKHVELIPVDEFKKIGVFQSIMSKFDNNDGVKACESRFQVMTTSPGNGDVKQIPLERVVCQKDEFLDGFSGGVTFCGVKLLWSDGTWEYGFKLWNDKIRVYDKNRKLQSLFVKVGVVNESTGKIDDVYEYEREFRIPMWILRLLPGYNERIRDLVDNDSAQELKENCVSLDDWKKVYDVMHSTYVGSDIKWRSIDIGKKKVSMPIGLSFNRMRWWTPVMTTWKDKICKEEFGALSDMLGKEAIKVFCYSYLKSIYQDNTKCVKEYKVIPVSDILMITKEVWDKEKKNWVSEPVWTNLDETCKGNV